MKKIGLIILCICFLLMGASTSSAVSIDLFEGALNVDSFISASGPGSVTVTGAGSHFVGLFLDYEIDEPATTWFNEYGADHNSLAAGQSWEIDEPGWVFGDIYLNFEDGLLDNTNGVPASAPDDVSMALGWNFTLSVDETAMIKFVVSPDIPVSGFFLSQTDPDLDETIYFSSSLDITGTPIPEPTTLILLGTGLVGLFVSQRKKLFKK